MVEFGQLVLLALYNYSKRHLIKISRHCCLQLLPLAQYSHGDGSSICFSTQHFAVSGLRVVVISHGASSLYICIYVRTCECDL